MLYKPAKFETIPCRRNFDEISISLLRKITTYNTKLKKINEPYCLVERDAADNFPFCPRSRYRTVCEIKILEGRGNIEIKLKRCKLNFAEL